MDNKYLHELAVKIVSNLDDEIYNTIEAERSINQSLRLDREKINKSFTRMRRWLQDNHPNIVSEYNKKIA